jgi:hypothetical protein
LICELLPDEGLGAVMGAKLKAGSSLNKGKENTLSADQCRPELVQMDG